MHIRFDRPICKKLNSAKLNPEVFVFSYKVMWKTVKRLWQIIKRAKSVSLPSTPDFHFLNTKDNEAWDPV